MSQSTELQADPATVAASLTAEAAALEGRLRQLHEEVHAVNAHIASIAETIHTMRATVTARGGGERRFGFTDDARPAVHRRTSLLRAESAPPAAPIRCRPDH
ncbi:hypothetical protein ACIO53_15995 [Streptomyces sp. NPDC087305]|uniref:hypothetical protein n=1 Tax=Streptomyces sp. NPDC087305 TaxID=3365781 RepID=UPI003823F92D